MTDLATVVEALRAGAPVVIPTDTVYGLAAAARDRSAVAAVFALKSRPVDKQMAVLVADAAQAADYVVDDHPVYRALTQRFWPGPLTVVALRRDEGALAAGDAATLGVRCPDDDFVRALAAEVGPVAATSANRSGDPTPTTATEVAALFPDVAVVVDRGPRSGAPSTVVSVVGPDPEILRVGGISAADISAALRGDS